MAEETTYSCERCGDTLRWHGGTHEWRCPSCGEIVRAVEKKEEHGEHRRLKRWIGLTIVAVLLLTVLLIVLLQLS